MELNDLLTELGVATPPAEPTQPTGTPTEPTVTPTDPPAQPNGEPTGDPTLAADPEPTPTPEPTPEPANSKTNRAFAEMRIRTQQYEKTLKSLGELLGAQDTSNPENLLNLVQERIVQAQAKQQNIPVEILQKLNMLESEAQRNQQQAIQQQALVGFQTVKNQFGLDDAGLDKFAEELASQGINPFAQPVDLIKTYRDIHWQDIMQKEIQKAVEVERQRALKAATQSTTPSSTTGGAATPPSQINSASELDAWFKDKIK